MKNKKKKSYLVSPSDRIFDAVMTGVPTIYLIVLFAIPAIAGLYFSLTNFGGFNLKVKFVGFYNYVKMLKDAIFWKSVWNYFKLYIGSSLVCFPLAFIGAVALTKNKRLKEREFYRVLFFLPCAVPSMIISIMWMTMFNPSFGVFNTILSWFGCEPVLWLGDTKIVMYSLIIVVVWRQMGFYMAYLMAGVSNIPDDIYESARIDGASEVTQTIKITVPLTWDVITTSMLFFVKGAINLGFGLVYIITRGGPDNASQIISSYMYYQITTNTDYGYASAISVAMLIITMLLSLFILKVMKRETYEY